MKHQRALVSVWAALLFHVFISTHAASVFQLDVCNKHRTVSEAPGTSLTFTKDGMCVVTSQVLTTPDTGRQHSCGGSKTSTAVVLRFPCQEEARLKQAAGPALNVWGSFDGVPQPTRTGIIVNEAAPAAARRQSATVHASAAKLVDAAAAGDANNSANATQPATNGTAPIKGNCSFLTVSPGLYFHRSPPMFTYGYVVSGLPCQQAASALATTQALEKAGGARTFATTYSMWLKPTLPAPPVGLSTEQQACQLVITVQSRSYVSTDKYPCNMKTLAPEELDDGCCYNAGGAAGGRRLLRSGWDLATSYRRALQWWH